MTWLMAILATYRVTLWVTHEKTAQWLRDWAKVYQEDRYGRPKTLLGKILGCFWCTSWFVAPMIWGVCACGGIGEAVVYSLGFSGGAIVLHHLVRTYRE